jgi:hypothetical protein
MVCEHLSSLEKELIHKGVEETFRGKAWSHGTREWGYFNCTFVDLNKTIKRLKLNNDVVKIHSHLGTHSGQEHGLKCILCQDAIMGIHPKMNMKHQEYVYLNR